LISGRSHSDNGPLSGWFNGARDSLDLQGSRLVAFEMSDVFKDPGAAAAMASYIMHRIRSVVRGSALPHLVFFDEAAPMLEDELFRRNVQVLQLGYLPRIRVLHTSEEEIGQVYVPKINAILLVSIIILILGFQSSDSLGAAYGIAISGMMLPSTNTSLPFLACFSMALTKLSPNTVTRCHSVFSFRSSPSFQLSVVATDNLPTLGLTISRSLPRLPMICTLLSMTIPSLTTVG
jgi:hypothetical protein